MIPRFVLTREVATLLRNSILRPRWQQHMAWLSVARYKVLDLKAGEGGLSRYEFTKLISVCDAARPTWGARGAGLSSRSFWLAEEDKIDMSKAKSSSL